MLPRVEPLQTRSLSCGWYGTGDETGLETRKNERERTGLARDTDLGPDLVMQRCSGIGPSFTSSKSQTCASDGLSSAWLSPRSQHQQSQHHSPATVNSVRLSLPQRGTHPPTESATTPLINVLIPLALCTSSNAFSASLNSTVPVIRLFTSIRPDATIPTAVS